MAANINSVIKYSIFIVIFIMLLSVNNAKEEDEENDTPKKSCSIWCWIQKIVLFVIQQLLSGN